MTMTVELFNFYYNVEKKNPQPNLQVTIDELTHNVIAGQFLIAFIDRG